MRIPKKYFLLFANLFFLSFSYAQENSYNVFVNISSGVQISGIKNEDFVSSNVSPLLDVNLGKWFSNDVGFAVGYRGTYFRLITDDIKHRYDFFYADTFFNLSSIIADNDLTRNSFLFSIGPGYFYRHEYNRPNVCAKLGLFHKYDINNSFSIQSGLSGVIGWDIYQGDDDILPSLQVGLNYQF